MAEESVYREIANDMPEDEARKFVEGVLYEEALEFLGIVVEAQCETEVRRGKDVSSDAVNRLNESRKKLKQRGIWNDGFEQYYKNVLGGEFDVTGLIKLINEGVEKDGD